MGLAYNHSKHAGNMGDVFKHIVLLATLEYLYNRKAATHSKDFTFGYAESHCGQAAHLLTPGGEWEQGIKRIVERGDWRNCEGHVMLKHYKNLCRYFVDSMEAGEPDVQYLSSWSFVQSALSIKGHSNYTLSLFDTSAEVAKSISEIPDTRIEFVCGDGYAGVKTLGSYRQDFVLIDPPYTMNGNKPSKDWIDAQRLAERLNNLEVPTLLWYPFYTNTNPDKLNRALNLPTLEFFDPQAPNNNRVMKGSGIVFAGFGDTPETDLFLEDLHRRLITIFENLGIVMRGRPTT